MANWNKSKSPDGEQGLANTINTEPTDVVGVDAQVDGTADAEKAKTEAKSAGSGAKGKIMKAAGVKAADVLSYNDETSTMVTAQGGKYSMSADGKKVVHLAGPELKEDAE